MKYKIGISGSAADTKEDALIKAQMLGEEFTSLKDKIIVITGVADGLPYKVAETAAKNGVEVWGFSARYDEKSQRDLYPAHDLSIYRKIFYIPTDYPYKNDVKVSRKYRNIAWTNACDAALIISGRWGTMSEFSNLYDFGKVIGIYTGTGGVADELPNLIKKITKKSKAVIFFEKSPTNLIKKILQELAARGRNSTAPVGK